MARRSASVALASAELTWPSAAWRAALHGSKAFGGLGEQRTDLLGVVALAHDPELGVGDSLRVQIHGANRTVKTTGGQG